MFNAYSIIGQISLIAWLAVMYPIFMQAAKAGDENDEASLSPLEEIIKLKGWFFGVGLLLWLLLSLALIMYHFVFPME